MKAKWFAIFSLVVVLAVAFSAVAPASAQPSLKRGGGLGGLIEESPNGIYIVQMINDPVVAYQGDVPGYRATKPARGQKINPNSPDVAKYAGYLKGKHDQALSKVGGQKVYDYVYSYNGFAARMSHEQAIKLLSVDGVLVVNPDQIYTADTSDTPHFLGLDAAGGLWEQLGGPTGGRNAAGAGDGIIIGIIDSGIWPESLSFTDRDATGKLVYQQIPGFHGKCDSAETATDGSWDANLCNKKLVAAQHFNAAWGGDAGIQADRPWEFISPRDYNGHGTHTASTAGGNYGVPSTGPGSVFGAVNGIAPRARIAAYKALWSTEDASTASGNGADLVAAIDQAVADGVDVINYSVSGTQTNFLDAAEVAFLFAADAGVFVATSAGNSGPTASTVAHPGPWVTTVAAGTHNRSVSGSVTLGNGASYSGASVASAVGPAPLVDSVNTGLTGANATEVELCYPGTLDPAKVTGTIVVCKRGVIARVAKSFAVQQAGGVGMVLYNDPDSSLNADLHSVPTVHVNKADGLAIKAYAATTGATATINAAAFNYATPAPFTADFSSRGPLSAGGGDLLKPDVIAPGQDIFAAVAPPGNFGLDFNVLSGTSMSSPHVAGLAALLKDLRPDWSPMAVKSALMTTGYDVMDSTNTASKIFRQGAGHVQPNLAADPGLVYDHGFNDWLAFLCGTRQLTASYCPSIAIDPSDLNVPSIAIGDLAGSQTVTRKVTNVGAAAATYTASVSGLSGVNTVVTPSSLTLNPGQTGSFTVAFTTAGAALNSYVGGYLTWNDGSHNVRIPLVVRPVALAAPAQVSGNGDPITYNVTFGYTGPFSATARGLIPAAVTPGTVTQDPDQTFARTDPTGTVKIPVTIPAGTTYARFSLFDSDVTTGTDLDLYVYLGTSLVGASTSGTSAEEVNFSFANPTASPIALDVYVHGWGVAGGSSPFKLHFWALGSASAGNMTVMAPATATQSSTGTINLTFSGLAPATRYLGSVAYGGDASATAPTIVRVDTP